MSATRKFSVKQKLGSPIAREQFKQKLMTLGGISWTEKSEQHCEYRLDGELEGGGWIRAKQYTNGTLFLETSAEDLLETLTGMAPDVGQTSLNGVKKPEKRSGKLDLEGAYIGTDESGKGDYFGPLVAAGVYVTEKAIPILVEIGVMDSKKLNDKTIAVLAQQILQTVGTDAVAVVEMGPKRYNELYAKFKAGGKNLNHLLAWGHATAIENILAAHHDTCTQAVADQFGNERYILSQLKDKGRQIKLFQLPRAEENVGVAAASILARNRFVSRLRRLSDQYGVELPLGAGPKVKAQARLFIQRHGREKLAEVAKLHFKTTEEL